MNGVETVVRLLLLYFINRSFLLFFSLKYYVISETSEKVLRRLTFFDSWLHKKCLTSYIGQLATKLDLQSSICIVDKIRFMVDDIHVYYFKHLIRFKVNNCNEWFKL